MHHSCCGALTNTSVLTWRSGIPLHVAYMATPWVVQSEFANRWKGTSARLYFRSQRAKQPHKGLNGFKSGPLPSLFSEALLCGGRA